MSKMPGIHLKAIPEDVFDLILEKKQDQERKKKKINMSQSVIMLLKNAYLSKETSTSRRKNSSDVG